MHGQRLHRAFTSQGYIYIVRLERTLEGIKNWFHPSYKQAGTVEQQLRGMFIAGDIVFLADRERKVNFQDWNLPLKSRFIVFKQKQWIKSVNTGPGNTTGERIQLTREIDIWKRRKKTIAPKGKGTAAIIMFPLPYGDTMGTACSAVCGKVLRLADLLL